MNPPEKPTLPPPSPNSSQLDDIGGEPLEGSGFEHETPEPDFTEVVRNPK